MGRPKGKPKTIEEEEALRQRRIANCKKWRTNNHDASLAYNSSYNVTRIRNIEKHKEYQEKYRTKKRAERKAMGFTPRKILTPEERIIKARENDARYRAEHPEKARERKVRYKKKHGERVRLMDTSYVAKRRALLLAAEGSFTIKDIMELYARQGGKCAMLTCRKPITKKTHSHKKFHIDHVKPLAKGGSNDPSNLQLLCRDCNHRKHAKDPEQWAKENGLLFV